jgi:hypothetical protein
MGIKETSVPVKHLHVISLELMLDRFDLGLNDPITPKRQVRHLYVCLYAISSPVDAPLAKS